MSAVGDARKRLAEQRRRGVDARDLSDVVHNFLGAACDATDLDVPPCWTLALRILASEWLAARLAEARTEERERVAAAIGARVREAQDEVQGADLGSVLIATVNAYADACSDLTAARIARSEAGA